MYVFVFLTSHCRECPCPRNDNESISPDVHIRLEYKNFANNHSCTTTTRTTISGIKKYKTKQKQEKKRDTSDSSEPIV